MGDVAVTAGNVAPGSDAGLDVTGVAGAALTAGQVVYYDSTNDEYLVADTETSSTTANAAGVVVCTAADTQRCVVQKTGQIDMGGTTVVGTVYVLSVTGNIAPAADLATADWVTVIGIGVTATDIKLGINASGVQVPA